MECVSIWSVSRLASENSVNLRFLSAAERDTRPGPFWDQKNEVETTEDVLDPLSPKAVDPSKFLALSFNPAEVLENLKPES